MQIADLAPVKLRLPPGRGWHRDKAGLPKLFGWNQWDCSWLASSGEMRRRDEQSIIQSNRRLLSLPVSACVPVKAVARSWQKRWHRAASRCNRSNQVMVSNAISKTSVCSVFSRRAAKIDIGRGATSFAAVGVGLLRLLGSDFVGRFLFSSQQAAGHLLGRFVLLRILL